MRLATVLLTAALVLLLPRGAPALAATESAGPARPAAAGTTVRVCGWGKVCVTFGRAATRRLDGAATEGVLVFAGVLCGEVPTRPRPVIAVKATCAGVAAGYYAAIKPVFNRAVRQDKRVEIGWRYLLTTLPTSWRVV